MYLLMCLFKVGYEKIDINRNSGLLCKFYFVINKKLCKIAVRGMLLWKVELKNKNHNHYIQKKIFNTSKKVRKGTKQKTEKWILRGMEKQ